MIYLPAWLLLVTLSALAAVAFHRGRKRVRRLRVRTGQRPHSLPRYYGAYVALWAFLPAFLLFCVWEVGDDWWISGAMQDRLPVEVQVGSEQQRYLALSRIRYLAESGEENGFAAQQAEDWMPPLAKLYQDMQALSRWVLLGGMLSLSLLCRYYARRHVQVQFPAREKVEGLMRGMLVVASVLSILVTLAILLSVLFEALRFFQQVPLLEFLFGSQWSPQAAIRADQGSSIGSFGALPLFTGTLLITVIALSVAVPVGLLAAIYMAEYSGPNLRKIAKPVLEVLAGVPTVVYGYFAAITIAPFIRDTGQAIGLDVASESALAAGLVMGVMIIPFVSSLSDDVINAVPQALRDASYGLGATQSETIKRVILPAATPGIMGAILLAFSRAVGETMIVVMAAGLAANLTFNPLDSVTTVTAQIVALMVGDQAFDSPTTLAAFALGLTLFILTLGLNFIALRIVNNYRRKYA